MYYLYLLGANMLRILTNVFFFKKKFGVEILAKLNNKISNISRIYTTKNRIRFFFPNFFVEKWRKLARKKKQKHCFSQNLFFFLRCFGVCSLFLHERFMFSQQPATNSFLMEERLHDGSSIYLLGQLGVFGGF